MTESKQTIWFWKGLQYYYRRSEFDSQKQLAITANVPESTLSEQFNEKRICSPAKQEAIANALGLDMVDILQKGKEIVGDIDDKNAISLYLAEQRYPVVIEIQKIVDRAMREKWTQKTLIKIMVKSLEIELIKEELQPQRPEK
jgi:hypothetical protein